MNYEDNLIFQSDIKVIQTYNHLVRNQFGQMVSVCLRTKWLWVRISLLSLKRQIWRLLRARSSLTFRQTIDCGFTLKIVSNMIITCTHLSHSVVLPTGPKSRDKNLYILRTKKAFKMKQKTFLRASNEENNTIFSGR